MDSVAGGGGESVAGGAEGATTNRGWFHKGDDPRRKPLHEPPVESIPEPEDEVGDGAPQDLKDMRWAYRNLGVMCKGTPQQEAFRAVYRRGAMKFTAELRKREREWREEAVRAPVAEESAPIVGGPRKGEGHPVVRLIDELLEEIGVREGAEGGGG